MNYKEVWELGQNVFLHYSRTVHVNSINNFHITISSGSLWNMILLTTSFWKVFSLHWISQHQACLVHVAVSFPLYWCFPTSPAPCSSYTQSLDGGIRCHVLLFLSATTVMMMIPKSRSHLLPELQAYIHYCLLDTSNWTYNRQLKYSVQNGSHHFLQKICTLGSNLVQRQQKVTRHGPATKESTVGWQRQKVKIAVIIWCGKCYSMNKQRMLWR